jgi:hypothetical protein
MSCEIVERRRDCRRGAAQRDEMLPRRLSVAISGDKKNFHANRVPAWSAGTKPAFWANRRR